MTKKDQKMKNDRKTRVWQLFADYARNKDIDRDFRNPRNPIYIDLSNQLQIPASEVRDIVLEMQPSLPMARYDRNAVRYKGGKCNLNNIFVIG